MKNSGSWRKRDGGNWEYRISIGYDIKGQRVRKSFYGKTKQECLAKYDECILRGNFDAPEKLIKITVGEWADQWLTAYKQDKVGHATYSQWEILIRLYLKPSCVGEKYISDVTPLDIEFVMKNMLKKSLSYQEKMRSLLGAIFERAIENDLCSKNPCKNIRLKRPSKKIDEQKYFTLEEVRIILEYCATHPSIVSLATQIMLYTGVRRGEVLGLQWNDIDFKKGLIHIRRVSIMEGTKKNIKNHTKTDAGMRDVPLLPQLRDVLLKEKRMSIFIVPDSNGNFFNAKNFSCLYKKFIVSIDGVRNLGTHACRHTLGTQLRRSGIDLSLIGEILGHEDAETTSIYAKVDADLKRQALEHLPY